MLFPSNLGGFFLNFFLYVMWVVRVAIYLVLCHGEDWGCMCVCTSLRWPWHTSVSFSWHLRLYDAFHAHCFVCPLIDTCFAANSLWFHNHIVSGFWTRGWMWDSDCDRDLRLPLLRGVAAFCRYSRVGNLDVRGALIFECSSLVDRSRCMGFRVYLTLFLVQNQA